MVFKIVKFIEPILQYRLLCGDLGDANDLKFYWEHHAIYILKSLINLCVEDGPFIIEDKNVKGMEEKIAEYHRMKKLASKKITDWNKRHHFILKDDLWQAVQTELAKSVAKTAPEFAQFIYGDGSNLSAATIGRSDCLGQTQWDVGVDVSFHPGLGKLSAKQKRPKIKFGMKSLDPMGMICDEKQCIRQNV